MAASSQTERALARSLAQTADPHDAFARALETIGWSLDWEFGAAWEPAEGSSDTLRCVETWYRSRDGVDSAAFAEQSKLLPLNAGEGLPGRVWATGEPAWITDVITDENFPRVDIAREAGLRAAFCFPIRSARGVLGAIEFFSAEPLDLDAELLATMANLGDQIGQVVERRRAAEQLHAKEARHRAMLDASLDCVVTMDHQGRVIDFNPAAERIFGYRAEEVVGREMADLIVPPDLREQHRAGLARYLGCEDPVLLDRRLEITGMRADGEVFPVELTITRIDVPGPPMFTGYIRDITDRRRAESELNASRTRIVTAADEARRRIERDLHDGAQQRLVELAFALRMARARIDDPAEATELLDTALEDLDQATRELRELARGIHPAVLTEGGLRPALESIVARAKGPTRLVAAPGERYVPAVEATAYFVVAEGLTNVSRYANASQTEVEVNCKDELLCVEVRDDGDGGARIDSGTGLLGLADRLSAIGGELTVDSPPGAGTTLRAEIPCE